jgi:hypothetical protein
MLALANANGVVEGSIPGLANICRVTVEECHKAIEILSSPDVYSRNPENEGRRIESSAGGWVILNYGIYREKPQDKEGSAATRMRRYRAKKKDCNALHFPVTRRLHVTQMKEERRQKTEVKEEKTLALSQARDRAKDFFKRFWEAYPKKRSKGQAEKVWAKIHPDEQLLEKILSTIERAKRSEDWIKDAGQFIPYPATWLNAKGWEDEVKTEDENWKEKVRSIK